MKQIFGRILGIEVSFTSTVEDFIKHTGPKITYTKQPLHNEFFIRSHALLFEQGVNDVQVSMSQWGDTPCFFPTGERSNIPYDIFAASFYLLSRYEEYLPHVKDMFGRFPYKESLAHQHNFLLQPVVDQWAHKLLFLLKERFPDLELKPKSIRFTSIIDVPISHQFDHRGFFRGSVGLLRDLIELKFSKVFQRLLVLLNIRKDPYNNFDELIQIHKKYRMPAMFFFQYAQYSRFDKNISTENNAFKYLIKSVADYSKVSLAASYSSFSKLDLLKIEKNKLTKVINKSVDYVRMRYNRVDVPETYRNLVAAEFKDDFSMGFTHEPGFKAGTCTSFYFYDVELEIQQPVKIHPFVIHDYALLNYSTEEEIFSVLDKLYEQVKKVNGHFMSVFSNELLGGSHSINWIQLYDKIIARYYV